MHINRGIKQNKSEDSKRHRIILSAFIEIPRIELVLLSPKPLLAAQEVFHHQHTYW